MAFTRTILLRCPLAWAIASSLSAPRSHLRGELLQLLTQRRFAASVCPFELAVVVDRAGGLSFRALRGVTRGRFVGTVQTQVVYLTDFHDEAKAGWVATFNEPVVTLGAERLSDNCVQPKYHGLDAFCEDEDPVEYFRAMMRAEPFTYSVRYLVGTPDTGATVSEGGAPEGFADSTSSAMSMWGSNPAAESRRRNPFLQKTKRYIEFDEEIVPSKMAQLVMRTREQLALEWAFDLRRLLPEEARDQRSGAPGPDGVNAESEFSPLRFGNIDLCERLATRAAALMAIHEVPAAEARYLKTRLAPEYDAPKAEVPPPGDGDGGDALARELADRVCSLQRSTDALGDHCAGTGKAAKWLQDMLDTEPFETKSGSHVDPPAIANNILKIRGELAASWADHIVDDVRQEHTALCRDLLEIQLERTALQTDDRPPRTTPPSAD